MTGNDLTKDERELLSLIAIGMEDCDIAERLGVCSDHVKEQVNMLFRKIDIRSRLQAMLWAGANLFPS